MFPKLLLDGPHSLGDGEQPFLRRKQGRTRKKCWPSAMAKTQGWLPEQHLSSSVAQHCLKPAPGTEGWHPAARARQFLCPLWVIPVPLDGEELPPARAQRAAADGVQPVFSW